MAIIITTATIRTITGITTLFIPTTIITIILAPLVLARSNQGTKVGNECLLVVTRPRCLRRGLFYLRKSSGSLAMFAAIRRTSSFVSSLAAERRQAQIWP
jgi:hypothetical protein